MKKKWLRTILVIASLFTCVWMQPFSAQAADAGDLTFALSRDGESYAVSGCDQSVSGKVEIPAIYNGKPVTRIDEWAFRGCANLNDVVIPEGVSALGNGAFIDCVNLRRVTLPDSIKSIGDGAFCRCSSLAKISIPDGVTGIGESAFSQCSSLVEVVLPNSVKNLGVDAFSRCSRLTDITFPNQIKTIPAFALSKCESLTDVAIPNGVTVIDDDAFFGCTALRRIHIPKGLARIDANAFAQCTALAEICVAGSPQDWDKLAIANGNEVLAKGEKVWNYTAAAFPCAHDWSCEEVMREATCKEAGEKRLTCAKCSGSKTQSVPKKSTHTYDDDCDTNCNVCGQTRAVSHDYKGAWINDASRHWHQCAVCGNKADVAAHTPSAQATAIAAQVCTECGYVIAPALGKPTENTTTTQATFDAKPTESTTPTESTEESEHSTTAPTDYRASADEAKNGGISWLPLLIVISVCLIGGICGVIIVRKKK